MQGSLPFEEMIFMEGVRGGDPVTTEWEIEDLSISLINSRKLSVQSLISLQLSCEDICD